MNLIFKEEAYRIIGACMNVYNDKGHGFVEPVYQECVEIEFEYQGIPYNPQQETRLDNRGASSVTHTFRTLPATTRS